MSSNVDDSVPIEQTLAGGTVMETTLIDQWSKFGAAIKADRAERGITQQALAETSGVSRAWLARFEAGHRRAELEQIFRVLDALDLSLAIAPLTRQASQQQILDALAARRRPR
jgi:HTH-type transcriptional regulator / antitoxin HipB